MEEKDYVGRFVIYCINKKILKKTSVCYIFDIKYYKHTIIIIYIKHTITYYKTELFPAQFRNGLAQI